MDSKRSINSFEIKKRMSPDYFRDNYFFWKFFNNFSVLFLKIFAALRSIVVVTVVTDWAVVL